MPGPPTPAPTPALPTIDRIFARLPIRLTLWLLLAIWFMGTWLTEPYLMGRGQDWAYFVHHTTVATRSWIEYGQVPMWNPWFCGGIPALANIQTDALSPDLLFTLPFDTPVALSLRLFLMIVLGLEGTWRYARHHRIIGWGAVVAATVFMFSGRFMMAFWDGHLPFLAFGLAPWAFLGLERAYERLHFAALSALALTWIFFDGGAVVTPIVVLMMGFLALRDTMERLVAPTPERPRRLWYRPFCALGVIGLLTLLLALPRLVPVLGTLIDYPRTWSEPEGLSLGHVAGMLFSPPHSWSYFDLGTSYVGLAIGLAFLLAIELRERVVFKLLVAALVTFDLAMGQEGPLQLWRLVHTLPVLENMRAAFRFTFLTALFVSLGAGRLVSWLETQLAQRGATLHERLLLTPAWTRRPRVLRALIVATTCALGGVAASAVGLAGPLATRQRLTEIPRLEVGPEAAGPFHQSIGTRWIAQVWPRVNIGSIACFEEQYFPTSAALRADRTDEEWLAEGDGEVRRIGWSPNAIELDVETRAGGIVAVNQNAARGWSVSVGRITAYEGLLAASLPPGRHRVSFTYDEPGFVVCAMVSLLTLAGLAVWLFRCQRETAGHALRP